MFAILLTMKLASFFVHIKQLNRFMKTALTGYGYEWAETQTERKRL